MELANTTFNRKGFTNFYLFGFDESYVVQKGDPVDEMLFIMCGKLLTMTTNGGRAGFFNSEYLKVGDFCEEEL